ncbi:mini-chromosome maintenance complex-binding protein-like isoform X2 [Halichondria panicea]|uniref:mini-chromosome maintenance complex-binding protein-like isoform X2 n=1 Tax=Halichondria panicea TaxID=6063 RepID=UPI00312BA6CF
MPVVQDKWISNPLDVVQELFESSTAPSWGVREYFESKINSQESLTQIPSLNHTPLHHLPEGTLVRYRAMVQDQFDPEFYLKVYHSRHQQTKAESRHCGMYRDVTEQPAESEIDFEHDLNVTGDRLTLYCVPIPGETKWAKDSFEAQSSLTESFSGSSASQSRLKRPLSEERDNCEGCDERDSCEGGGQMEVSEGEGLMNKRPRDTSDIRASTACKRPDMNTPLPNEEGVTAIVKVYSDFDSFKVTSMVEFIGVLSVDPSLACFESTTSEGVDSLINPVGGETAAERKAHSPPPSLIPRLHTITARFITHSCPLLPRELSPPVNNSSILSQLSCDVSVVRQMTLDLLTRTLLGDSVAAEYVLLHLISSVYGRTDVLALGKFAVNLTNFPPSLVDSLHTVLETIVTKCHLLSMSLENMNKSRFSPKKDYHANRLTAGLLQLTDGTHLVVDETALTPGQLSEVGVQNLTALGNLIQWQKVSYDFQYHTAEFETNVPVLLLSEGKSILQTDCWVPMVTSCSSVPQQQLTEDQLHQIRLYLALCRMLQYTLSDDIKKNLEEDFVLMRRSDSSVTAEVFHHLLGVSRLVALSRGSAQLTMDHWTHTKHLEALRSNRHN